MQFNVRYDLRNPPESKRPFETFYADFLEHVTWADEQGFSRVILQEHHCEPDGYLPCPLTLAAAVAARTTRIRIMINILVLSLKHPVEVAEQAALVDILSGGRLDLCVAGGYRREEFEAYGIPRAERGSRVEEGVEIIRRCWEQESFDFDGRHWKLRNVRCTPRPVQKPRPALLMGGNSAVAARRAARIADGFLPVDGKWLATYREECSRLGRDPGPEPPADAPQTPGFLHVSTQPEADWQRIAPYALYENNAYGRYTDDDELPYQPVEDSDPLRRSGAYAVLSPDETTELGRRLEASYGSRATLTFHPLMGGMPRELGERSLKLVASDVMPHFRG